MKGVKFNIKYMNSVFLLANKTKYQLLILFIPLHSSVCKVTSLLMSLLTGVASSFF